MAYFLDNYPISEECANLVLTEEQEKNCRVVYKLDDEGGAHIFEPWNPDVKYSDKYVVFTIRSTGAKRVLLRAGTKFANVINSVNDPRVDGKNWLKLWLDITGTRFINECVTDNNFYCIGKDQKEYSYKMIYYPKYKSSLGQREESFEAATCFGSMVGGHIIIDTTSAAYVAPGGRVFILPICDKHNVAHKELDSRWGTGFYMKLSCDTKAAQLENFKPNVIAYIEKYKDNIRHE